MGKTRHLHGSQKEEAVLSILKEQIVRKINLLPEPLFDDIFMPRKRGFTFPMELAGLARGVKELALGKPDSDPVLWTNPEEYTCVQVTNEMIETGRNPSEGLYNTVVRNIQAYNLFLTATTAYQRLCAPVGGRRLTTAQNIELAAMSAIDEGVDLVESVRQLLPREESEVVEDRRVEAQAMSPVTIPTHGAQPRAGPTYSAQPRRILQPPRTNGCYALADAGVCPFGRKCKFSHDERVIAATKKSDDFLRWREANGAKAKGLNMAEAMSYLQSANGANQQAYSHSEEVSVDLSDGEYA